MRKLLLFTIVMINISCYSQENISIIKKIDLSSYSEMNYISSRIHNDKPISKELYKNGLFITIFEMSDSKATPEDYFDGYDASLSSYLVSVAPDGDYYSWSKLYKIEAIENPKIIAIEESEYPNFIIKVEYGAYNNKKIKNFKIVGK